MAFADITAWWTSIAIVFALASPCRADDPASSSSDIQLGQVPHYASEDAARTACQPDSVVWADRKTGFYYPKFLPDYGKTPHGTYTCYQEAKKADYWSLTPASDGGHKGREFPEFFCTACY